MCEYFLLCSQLTIAAQFNEDRSTQADSYKLAHMYAFCFVLYGAAARLKKWIF